MRGVPVHSGVDVLCGGMADELTNDNHLRALAALEAVVQNNDGALEILAGGADERPLAALLAAYGQHTLQRVLLAAFGIEATMTTTRPASASLRSTAIPWRASSFS